MFRLLRFWAFRCHRGRAQSFSPTAVVFSARDFEEHSPEREEKLVTVPASMLSDNGEADLHIPS
jgi:hypothetical protein